MRRNFSRKKGILKFVELSTSLQAVTRWPHPVHAGVMVATLLANRPTLRVFSLVLRWLENVVDIVVDVVMAVV